MKKLLIFAAVIAISTASFAQGNINRGDWMLGGDVGYESRSADYGASSSTGKEIRFNLSPNIGYFFIDNLAGGIRLNRESINYKSQNSSNKFIYTFVGPFLRYYFLPSSQKLNIFLDGAYTLGGIKFIPSSGGTQKFKLKAYNFNAGAAYFINPAFAVELSLGYISRKDTDADINVYSDTQENLFFSVGFQIHLPGNRTKAAGK
jgi:hypothetical protein